MAQFAKTLKTVLETATGNKCYAMEKPIKGTLPCTVYNIFPSDPVATQSGADSLRSSYVQITHIAKTAASLHSLIKKVEDALFYNTTDFSVVVPSMGTPTRKEDKLYYSHRDYLIWYAE